MNGYIKPSDRHSLGRVTKNKHSIIFTEPRAYSALTVLMFLIFCAYTALPIIDIPLLGLSLSAPLIYFVALEVFFKPPERWIGRYRKWIVFAVGIWLGLTISAIGNGLISGGIDFDIKSGISIIQYGYWLLVFVISLYFISRLELGELVVKILIGAIFVLAILRLGEAIFYENIGFGKDHLFLTRNAYGFLFSTFAPLGLILLVGNRNWLRSVIILLVITLAIAINASRGSWISVTISCTVFLVMILQSRKKTGKGMITVIIFFTILYGVLALSPQKVTTLLNERMSTFQNLEDDKSYVIRQLMIQKGWRLFKNSPIFGVGIGRFRVESVPLDLPEILRYAPTLPFESRSAHNSYILILAEGGLVGAIPYFLLVLTLLISGYPVAILLAREGNVWAIGIYVSLVGMSVNLWSVASITGTTPWFMYGLAASILCFHRLNSRINIGNNSQQIY